MLVISMYLCFLSVCVYMGLFISLSLHKNGHMDFKKVYSVLWWIANGLRIKTQPRLWLSPFVKISERFLGAPCIPFL